MPGLLCAVAFCKSNSSKTGEKISFFGFPRDIQLRNDWVKRCNRKEKFDPLKRKVCHKHFRPDDFEDALSAKMLNKNPRRLKSNAVPSLFLTPDKRSLKTKFVLDEHTRKEEQRKLVEELLQDDQRKPCSNLTDLSKLDLQKIGPEIGLDQEACNGFSLLIAAQSLQKDNESLKVKEQDSTATADTVLKENLDHVGVRCFVCDKTLHESDVSVYSRTDVAQVIRKLLGAVSEDFVMVIKEEDQLCGACQMLVTRISRLEAELRTATLALRALLRLKYSLDFGSLEKDSLLETENMNLKRKRSKEKNILNNSKRIRKHLRQNLHKKQRPEVQVIPCTIGYIQRLDVEDCKIQDEDNVVEPSEGVQGNSLQQCGGETTNLLAGFASEEKIVTSKVVAAMNEETVIESDKNCKDVESDIDDHLNEESKETFENQCKKLYKCGMCNLVATSVKAIHAHYLSYKEKKGHYCAICDFGFHHRTQSKRHLASHSEVSQNIFCTFCDVKVHDRLHLKFHVQKEHRREAFTHNCQDCYKSFLHKRSLRKHNLIIHNKQTTFTCEKCNCRFNDKMKYMKHTEYYHRKQLICKFCKRHFSCREKLYLHEYRHKYFSMPQYYCSFCPRKFIKQIYLSLHEEQHFGKFRCQECELGFHDAESLENHQSQHLKSFLKDDCTMCDVCGKTFASRGTYRIHRLLHDNPHPFQCDICLKRFRYKNKLVQHKRHFHLQV